MTPDLFPNEQERSVPHDEGVARLRAIRQALGGDEEFTGIPNEKSGANAAKQYRESEKVKCPPAPASTEGSAACPERESATPTAAIILDGNPLCISGCNIWPTHDTGMGRTCKRCGWEAEKLTL